MVGTLLVINDQKEKPYKEFMETVAVTVYKHSMDAVRRLSKTHTNKEIVDSSKAVAAATGQIVLDDIISRTKDMSREELVEYMAESSIQAMTMCMNKNPAYRMKIQFLASFEAKNEQGS